MDLTYGPPRKKVLFSASANGEKEGSLQGSNCSSSEDHCESYGKSRRKFARGHAVSGTNPILGQVAESLSHMVKVQQQMLDEMRSYHQMMLDELGSIHQTVRGSADVIMSRRCSNQSKTQTPTCSLPSVPQTSDKICKSEDSDSHPPSTSAGTSSTKSHETISERSTPINVRECTRLALLLSSSIIGDSVLAVSSISGTRGTKQLPVEKLHEIKEKVREQKASKASDAEFEAVWKQCMTSITHKCKSLRQQDK